MIEWSIIARCKRAAFGLRGFESLSAHQNKTIEDYLKFKNFGQTNA